MLSRQVTREISYAGVAASRRGRAMIRVLENSTGRLRLIRRAFGYELDVAEGQNFWQVMVDRYGLALDLIAGSLDHIPEDGPLILTSNHPYGILDGLMMGHILARTRGDFKIMAHNVFRKAEDINRYVLPINFANTKAALRENLATRKEALRYLDDGGAIGIFPGGSVATGIRPFAPPMDPVWRSFTAKMVAKSGATVVPMFFDGKNSRLFQIASHLHYNLRVGLLIKEFRRRIDEPVRVAIGDAIDPAIFANLRGDSKAIMDYLRKATYDLSPRHVDTTIYGPDY